MMKIPLGTDSNQDHRTQMFGPVRAANSQRFMLTPLTWDMGLCFNSV